MSLEEIARAKLTTDDAAALVGVTRETIRSWMHDGVRGRHLPFVRKGKRIYIAEADLVAFVSGHNARAEAFPAT